MSYKYWAKRSIILVSLFISLTVLFNLIVDANGIFNIVNIEKFNKTKNHISNDGRSKFYNAKNANPEVLLMGTSRTENINPKHLSKYVDGRIYNLAVKGSGVTLHKKNIEYFIKNNNINTIVYGLDLFSFNPLSNRYNENLDASRYTKNYLGDYLDILFGSKQLSRSIKTVKSNIKSDEQVIDLETGWATNLDNIKDIEEKGIEVITQDVINKDLFVQKHFFNSEIFKDKNSIDRSLEVFDDIVKLCKENNVKLYLFISPIYSKINTMIDEKGYGNTYKYWKQSLSKYGDIYDFSGYNSITNNINNFYDGHHYIDDVSKFILARVFNDKDFEVPDDFGVVLKK